MGDSPLFNTGTWNPTPIPILIPAGRMNLAASVQLTGHNEGLGVIYVVRSVHSYCIVSSIASDIVYIPEIVQVQFSSTRAARVSIMYRWENIIRF